MIKGTILLFFFSVLYWRLGAQTAAVTDSAALQLGHAIEKDDDVHRQDRLSQILDQASFIHRMEENCPPLRDPAFKRGFMETFLPNLPRIGVSISSAANGGSYRLLREYDSNGVKHLLFRVFGKQGLNYHDYTLINVGDSVKAADIYLYTTGEYFSNTMADLVTTMDASHDLAKESDEVQALTRIRDDYNKHKYPDAKAIYDGLSPKLRDQKAIQVIYIAVSRKLGDSLYESALNHFQVVFPDAPNSYLLMIDLCFLKKNYEKGIQVVDKLDGMVKDPILNLFRGNFLKLSGKSDESIACYQKAFQYDPGFKVNTLTLIVTYAQNGRSDDARKIIAGFKLQKSFQPEDLEDVYTAFPALKD